MANKVDSDVKEALHLRQKIRTGINEIILPAIKAGGITGGVGLFVGSFIGVARSKTPRAYALASGIQWFILGTSYWGTRASFLHSREADQISKNDRLKASGLAGAVTGSAAGLLRSTKNIIPGAIVFALLGVTGQSLYTLADERKTAAALKEPQTKTSWLDSKWSPIKPISDEDYGILLREKLLRVDAEIAIVDERIQALREYEKAMATSEKSKDR